MPAPDQNSAGGAVKENSTAPQSDAILPPIVDETDYHLITTLADLERWIAEAKAQGFVAIDTETTSLDAARAELVGVAMALSAGRACYIPLRHVQPGQAASDTPQQGLDFSALSTLAPRIEQINYEAAIARLAALFADESVLKIGHNLKYDMHVLSQPRNGALTLYPVDDTMCLSYVLDAGRTDRHGLDHLALNLLQVKPSNMRMCAEKGPSKSPLPRSTASCLCLCQ